jgi:hypothetical protein
VFAATQSKTPKGSMPFLRKIANKLVELKAKSPEVDSFLESIPEWEEYYSSDLQKVNLIESRPLGQQDHRKKQEDDTFDIFLKLQEFRPKTNDQEEQEEEEEEEEEDEEEEEEKDLEEEDDLDLTEENNEGLEKYLSNEEPLSLEHLGKVQ